MSRNYRRLGVIPTFRALMSEAGVSLDGLDSDDIDGYWATYDEMVWHTVSQLRRDPKLPVSLGALNHFLAQDVIADHLGVDWLERNVINANASEQTRDYIGLEGHALRKALSLYRIQDLGRRLYQLQSFSWFESVLEGVRRRELSGAAFELDVLWYLQIASPYVATRPEVGAKGSDYDCFALMDDKMVPVEVKAKDDRTPWSPKTVINTIKSASRQLPKHDTGLLFLRIPPAWVGPTLEDQYHNVLAEATRQTSRIGAIVTVIDKTHLTGETTASVTRLFDQFTTDKCPPCLASFCSRLQRLWNSGMTQMAPDPPF